MAEGSSSFEAAAQLWALPWEAGWVTSVAFVGSGRRLAAGNQAGQILVWDLPDQPGATPPPPVRRLDGHTNFIAALAATPDGRRLVSASYDHTVRVWDMDAKPSGSDSVVLQGGAAAGRGGVKPADKAKSAPVSVETQKSEQTVTLHGEWVRSLSLSADGNLALSGDDNGAAVLWQVPDGKEIRRLQVKGWLPAVALSPDAALAATCEFAPRYATFPNANRVWDRTSGEVKFDLAKELASKGGESKALGMAAAAFSPDGKLLALGRGGEVESDTAKVYLVDTAGGKKVRELAGHQYGVTGLCFHPDGQTLVSCGRDTVVRLWRAADGKLLKELGKPRGGQFKDWTHAVAVSPDGRRLAAADMAGAVAVWSLGS